MNIRHTHPLALGAALVAALGLAACQPETDDTLEGAPPVAGEPVPATDPGEPPTMPDDAIDPMDSDPMDGDMADSDMAAGTVETPTALEVTSVAVGSEAGPDDTLAMPQNTLAPDDDIVVAIDTDGAATEAELSARLIYEDGQMAGEQTETISTTGADTTTVTFSNEQPWPTGAYTVEIWVDGTQAESTELTVE